MSNGQSIRDGLTPHTTTDDELRQEAELVQKKAWAEIHGQDPQRKYSVAEVKRIVYSFDNVIGSLFARRPVQGDPREVAHIACDCVPDLGPEHCHLCGERNGKPTTWADCASRVAVQGEPSDAQVEAGCAAFYEGAQGLTSWARLTSAEQDLANRYRDGIRAALRSAYATKGGATQ